MSDDAEKQTTADIVGDLIGDDFEPAAAPADIGPEPAEPSEPEAKAEAEPESKPEKEPPKRGERTRDASGKFTKQVSKPALRPDAKAAPVPAGKEVAAPEEPDAELDPIIPPARLNAEQKAAFKSWPRQAQEAFSRAVREQERDYTQKSQQLAQSGGLIQRLKQATEPYAEDLRLEGVDPISAYERMLAWNRAFKRNPQAAARQMLQTYQIDPRTLFNADGQSAEAEPAYEDPRFSQLQQLVSNQQSMLQQIQQERQANKYAAAQSDYEAWRDATDEEGDPAHPYLEDFEQEFAQKVARVKAIDPELPSAKILDEAYEALLRAHPDIREAIDKKAAAKKRAKDAAEADAAAKKARRAAISPKGGSPAGTTKAIPTKTSELLMAVMDGTLD